VTNPQSGATLKPWPNQSNPAPVLPPPGPPVAAVEAACSAARAFSALKAHRAVKHPKGIRARRKYKRRRRELIVELRRLSKPYTDAYAEVKADPADDHIRDELAVAMWGWATLQAVTAAAKQDMWWMFDDLVSAATCGVVKASRSIPTDRKSVIAYFKTAIWSAINDWLHEFVWSQRKDYKPPKSRRPKPVDPNKIRCPRFVQDHRTRRASTIQDEHNVEPAERRDEPYHNRDEPATRTAIDNACVGRTDERIVELRIEGRTYREIAEELEIPSSTVFDRLRAIESRYDAAKRISSEFDTLAPDKAA